MKAYKFNVGDEVRLKQDLEIGKKYGAVTLFPKMYNKYYKKKIHTVQHRVTDDAENKGYAINSKRMYYYDESMLEEVERSSEEILYKRCKIPSDVMRTAGIMVSECVEKALTDYMLSKEECRAYKDTLSNIEQ